MSALSEYLELLETVLEGSSLSDIQRMFGNLLWKVIAGGDENCFEIMQNFLKRNDLWDPELGHFAERHTVLLKEMGELAEKDPFGEVRM